MADDIEYLASDPDDSDYQPPDEKKGGAGSSAAPQPGGSETDSVAADAFYIEDAVPEYADSDIERPPPRPIGSAGAGSSSRPGGSSGAGSSSRAGGPSGAGGSSSAAPPPRVGGASSANGSGNGVLESTDEITPVVSAAKEALADEKAVASEKEAIDGESAKEAAASKKAVDDLWREMNKPIAKAANSAKPTKEVDSGLGDWLKPSTVPKSTIRKVPRLEEVEIKRAAEEAADAIQPVKKQKLGTGLEDILNAAKGEQKSNTLDKTKESWKEFKKDDKEVEDELEAYKKDKNRYTDKVSFLERSSHREWEVEQAGKKKR